MYLSASPLTSGKLSSGADLFQKFLAVFLRKELEKRPAVRASTGPCD